jgi:hypothetical protein
MARKTTGNATPRSRKAAAGAGSSSIASVEQAAVNLDEEIRQRAYQLYLERKGTAGDPNRDWLVAESEVRSRHSAHNHSA